MYEKVKKKISYKVRGEKEMKKLKKDYN